MSIYFAYGSNIDPHHMKLHCPRAEVLMIQRLKNYRFFINSHGVATIVPSRGYHVEGILWSLSKECEENIDTSEGIHESLYRKKIDTISR